MVKEGKSLNRIKDGNKKWAFLFVVTNVVLFATFFAIPFILGFYYSLTDADGFTSNFIGLNNYIELFQDPSFFRALTRTLTYVVLVVPSIFCTSLLIAVLLVSKKTKGKALAKIIFFLPWTVSGIISGVIWRWLFGESFGFINYVIDSLGGEPQPWFTNGNLALMVIIMAATWGATAFNMLIFMAALKNIPITYYEAADIDGANSIQKFRHITLPALVPTSFLVILLATIGSMREFVMVQALTNGGPGTDNTFIVQYIYVTGFERNRVGYASAVSMVLFVLLLCIAIIQLKFEKRWRENA